MKFLAIVLLTILARIPTSGQTTSPLRHIVVIVQENRSPDNLFQGLCKKPFGAPKKCSMAPTKNQYNIQVGNWHDLRSSPPRFVQPTAIPLDTPWDPSHGHTDFVAMCLANSPVPPVRKQPPPLPWPVTPMPGATYPTPCTNGGAAAIGCDFVRNSGTCPTLSSFSFVDNRKGRLQPYLALATQYGFANYMFQTNQGPSFPAHQFIYGGTSAPSEKDDDQGIFASENTPNPGSAGAGCATTQRVQVIINGVESQTRLSCFQHVVMSDRLTSWKYYAFFDKRGAGANTIWNAPNAIQHVCNPQKSACQFPPNVDLDPTHVLTDISSCRLPSVSWVTPSGLNSDHAGLTDGSGPSWVASIINTIGQNPTCVAGTQDAGETYWNNTAILVTWDDWGGWYDHESPPLLVFPQGYYQYGFRVPLLVVSAYTPVGIISNTPMDFGSILRFIELTFNVQGLGFADERSRASNFSDLTEFFDFSQRPRPFTVIQAPRNAAFFLNDKRESPGPDTD